MVRLRALLCIVTLMASCSGDAVAPTTSPIATATTATNAAATTPQPVAAATTTVASTTLPAPTTTVAPDASDEGATWLTADQPGSTVLAALDPEDRLVIGYWTSVGGAVRVLRCADPKCLGPKETFTLGSLSLFEAPNETLEPYLMDMALDLQGSPIVIARDPSQEPLRIWACADPDCTEVGAADFVTAGPADYTQIVVAADGLPRIAYFESSPSSTRLMLAVCGDAQCRAEQRSTLVIDDNVEFYSEPDFVVDPDDRLFIGYNGISPNGTAQGRVAVCADAACSSGPSIITFDNAASPRITNSDGDKFTVWYRSGPAYLEEGDVNTNAILDAFELHVTECDTGGCGEPTALAAEWGLLNGWHHRVGLTSLADGDVGVTYSYWSQEACAEPLELWRFDPGLDRPPTKLATYVPVWGGIDSLAQGDELLVIFSGEGGGLQLVSGSMEAAADMDGSPCKE